MSAALFIPGIGDDQTVEWQRKFVERWSSERLHAVCFHPQWNTDEPYDQKLKRLLDTFDQLESDSVFVSSASAGGSLSVALLSQRSDKIVESKTVCGKLQGSDTIGERYQKIAPALQTAVRDSENSMANISESSRSKVINYQPLVDMVVPMSDMLLDGAQHKRLLTSGHAFTIGFALLFILKPSPQRLQKS